MISSIWNRFKQVLRYITTPHPREVEEWRKHDGQWDENGWP